MGGLRVARNRSIPYSILGSSSAPENSDNEQVLQILNENQRSLQGINSSLISVSAQISQLNASLTGISNLISQNSQLEKLKDNQRIQQENILAQQQLRAGKESVVEKKIQASALEPAQKLGSQAQSSLANLRNIFIGLFAGWLTNQIVNNFKTYSDNIKKFLNLIKGGTEQGLKFISGLFSFIKGGFENISSKVSDISKNLYKSAIGRIFERPFTFVIDKLKEFWGNLTGKIGELLGIKKPDNTPDNTKKPDNAEKTDSSPPPPPNTGATDNKSTKDQSPLSSMMSSLSDLSKQFLGGLKETTSTPEIGTSSGPEMKMENYLSVPSDTNKQTTSTGNSQIPDPTPEMVKNYEMAWKYRNYSLARGKIESAWQKMSPMEQNQAVQWANKTGKEWKEMKLPDPKPLPETVESPQSTPNITPAKVEGNVNETTSTEKSSPTNSYSLKVDSKNYFNQSESKDGMDYTKASFSAGTMEMDTKDVFNKMPPDQQQIAKAEINSPPKDAKIAMASQQEPEPKTQVVLTEAPVQSTQKSIPNVGGYGNNLNSIASSNPDNFYALYSQINYNVVG
jgi:hypothetical protein